MIYRKISCRKSKTYLLLPGDQITNVIGGDRLHRRQVGAHRDAQEVVALLLGAELGAPITSIDRGVLINLVVAVDH